MKIQLSITELEQIVKCVMDNKRVDNSLSRTIEIELVKTTDSHSGSDSFRVIQKSSYSDCDGVIIGDYNLK